jgi:uncharacterized protein (TIGR00369 family)
MDSVVPDVRIPFAEHLGLRIVRMADGEAVIEFEPRPEHCNSFEVAHGGTVMTILDVAMALAARSLQPESGSVTIEMKTSFMQPSRGLLQARARVMHRTASIAFCEATVTDPRGRSTAHASGTFKYVPPLPIGPKGAEGTKTVISTD